MADKRHFLLFVIFISSVHSANIFERSYEYVLNIGKSMAPSFMSFFDCFVEDDTWACARERAGKILDNWNAEVQKQRRIWQKSADEEALASGRSFTELPSKLGREIEDSLYSVSDLLQHGMARALARKKHEGGGIDSITISTASDKKKTKKKKQKPPKIHLVHPVIMPMEKTEEKGVERKAQSWVIGRNYTESGRGFLEDAWNAGEKALDAVAQHAIDSDNAENGVVDKSSLQEQRGKKKKKKKAILKLLILGAVLKAKIGTLLQILSFKLQVKFFIIALIGLGINLARFWVELKHKHAQPQKVIYYEHAQHQHHYEHEEEEPAAWGPWARTVPEEIDSPDEVEMQNTPYRAHERIIHQYPSKPLLTLS